MGLRDTAECAYDTQVLTEIHFWFAFLTTLTNRRPEGRITFVASASLLGVYGIFSSGRQTVFCFQVRAVKPHHFVNDSYLFYLDSGCRMGGPRLHTSRAGIPSTWPSHLGSESVGYRPHRARRHRIAHRRSLAHD